MQQRLGIGRGRTEGLQLMVLGIVMVEPWAQAGAALHQEVEFEFVDGAPTRIRPRAELAIRRVDKLAHPCHPVEKGAELLGADRGLTVLANGMARFHHLTQGRIVTCQGVQIRNPQGNRVGRHYSSGFARDDHQSALNTLRYMHANPKAAGMTQGFRYGYSNDGTYEQLVDDGLTQWHPAFLQLGDTLEVCAARYRAFCQRYTTKHKPGGRRSRWGVQWLPRLPRRQRDDTTSAQLPLWEMRCQVELGDTPPQGVLSVANCFVQANTVSSAEALR